MPCPGRWQPTLRRWLYAHTMWENPHFFFNRFQTVSGTHFDYWTKMLRGLFEVQNGGAASIVKFRKAFFKTVLK